jgi:hypothetical protein
MRRRRPTLQDGGQLEDLIAGTDARAEVATSANRPSRFDSTGLGTLLCIV